MPKEINPMESSRATAYELWITGFQDAGEQVVLIEPDYELSVTEILTSVEN